MASNVKADNARRLAWPLAVLGLTPFAVLAMALLMLGASHPLRGVLTDLFRIYSALILAFLGGIRWGLALRDDPEHPIDLLYSAAPVIVGWATLVLPTHYSLLVLLVSHCGQGAWDSISFHRGRAPEWFARLRIVMTLLVVMAHLSAFLSL
jgi:hypothetical protein